MTAFYIGQHEIDDEAAFARGCALVLTLLRNTVSELIKSGLFFGETTFYKAFLFSSQECPQNFSVSFDVCLVREQ